MQTSPGLGEIERALGRLEGKLDVALTHIAEDQKENKAFHTSTDIRMRALERGRSRDRGYALGIAAVITLSITLAAPVLANILG